MSTRSKSTFPFSIACPSNHPCTSIYSSTRSGSGLANRELIDDFQAAKNPVETGRFLIISHKNTSSLTRPSFVHLTILSRWAFSNFPNNHEYRVARNLGRIPMFAEAELQRILGFHHVSLHHELHSFFPSGNDLIQSKRGNSARSNGNQNQR